MDASPPLEDAPVRAPLPQFRDTLIDSDPAQRMPSRPSHSNAANHPLEAFRDFRSEGAGAAGSSAGDGPAQAEVFGLTKKPKNLAEIYKAPTELSFVGSFDELRDAGREQRRWLLVNIQSPTEFASQQLNADTWRDETLCEVIKASFLFWQQYYDNELGSTYCRYYLNPPQGSLPHIGIVDPMTGELVKKWTGFTSSERLMDKLMDYADAPPADSFAEMPQLAPPPPWPVPMQAQATVPGGEASESDAELAAAIAASLERSTPASTEPPPPAEAPAAEEEETIPWPDPPQLPAQGTPDSVTLRVRLSTGPFTRTFSLQHTLADVFCVIHHESEVKLSMAKTYQLVSPGEATYSDRDATLGSLGLKGRIAVNLSEAT